MGRPRTNEPVTDAESTRRRSMEIGMRITSSLSAPKICEVYERKVATSAT